MQFYKKVRRTVRDIGAVCNLKIFLPIVALTACKQPNNSQSRNIVLNTLTVKENTLIYTTWDKEVVVEDLAGQLAFFRRNLSDVCYSKPVLEKGKLYFAQSTSEITCVDIVNGKTVWQNKVPNRCTAMYYSNGVILLDIKHYGFIGINSSNGKIVYRILFKYGNDCLIPDLSPYRIAVLNDNFFVNNWDCSMITAYNIRTGKKLWSKNEMNGQSNLAVSEKGLFVGNNDAYKDGAIFIIDKDGKEILFSMKTNFEQNFNPIIVDNKVFYYCYDLSLHAFDLKRSQDSLALKFVKENSPAGHQMYLADRKLFYNNDKSVYEYDILKHTLTKIGNTEKDLCGVIKKDGKIKFLY